MIPTLSRSIQRQRWLASKISAISQHTKRLAMSTAVSPLMATWIVWFDQQSHRIPAEAVEHGLTEGRATVFRNSLNVGAELRYKRAYRLAGDRVAL